MARIACSPKRSAQRRQPHEMHAAPQTAYAMPHEAFTEARCRHHGESRPPPLALQCLPPCLLCVVMPRSPLAAGDARGRRGVESRSAALKPTDGISHTGRHCPHPELRTVRVQSLRLRTGAVTTAVSGACIRAWQVAAPEPAGRGGGAGLRSDSEHSALSSWDSDSRK